jgi:hypothetical protein
VKAKKKKRPLVSSGRAARPLKPLSPQAEDAALFYALPMGELTRVNPVFRAAVLDEIDKQRNAGRPRWHRTSIAWACARVEEEYLRLRHEFEAAPATKPRPAITRAIEAAAASLGVEYSIVRAHWYGQSRAARDNAVRALSGKPPEISETDPR